MLPAKLTGFAALTPQQQEVHRKKIGVRAEAILGQFWRDDETEEVVRILEQEGFMDVLENCSHSEIRQSWKLYQQTGQRTAKGKLYKPDAGALYHIILRSRPRPELVKPKPELPADPPATKEQAAAILKDVGFNVRRFGV